MRTNYARFLRNKQYTITHIYYARFLRITLVYCVYYARILRILRTYFARLMRGRPRSLFEIVAF